MPGKLPNTLIIEGHGATFDPKSSLKANYFDFRRSDATKCNLYSYVREGALMPARDSNEKILWSINHGGAIPACWVEVTQSRIGGARVRDRIIYAIDYKIVNGSVVYDWNYELPSDWYADTIQLNAIGGGTVEAITWYNRSTGPKSSSVVWFTLRGEGPHDPIKSVLLSTVLDYFNTQSYDVLWMVCRE
jgi:hypothetical protein